MDQGQVLLENLKFEEQADYEKDFSDYFEEKIKPALSPLEDLRLQKMNQAETMKRRLIIPNVLIAIGFTLGITGIFPKLAFLTLVLPISLLISAGLVVLPGIEYQEDVIKTLVPMVLAFLGNFSYSRNGRILPELLTASNLFQDFDDYAAQDYISGKYQGIDLEINSAWMTHGQGKGTATVFTGKMILLKMNKQFSGKTILLPSSSARKYQNMELVSLEDPKFEKVFKVYSTDQVEARYLLTPDFMEKLDQLATTYNTDITQASFFDDRLLLTFSSKAEPAMLNLFQIGSLNESIIDTDDLHHFLKEMHGILETVKILQLSNQPSVTS